MEKNKDEASSNRHNAAQEIVVTEARLEQLRRGSCVGQKKSYSKINIQWWSALVIIVITFRSFT